MGQVLSWCLGEVLSRGCAAGVVTGSEEWILAKACGLGAVTHVTDLGCVG